MTPTDGIESRHHILAINNDQAVLNLFRDLLEEEGFRATTRAYVDKDLAAIAALQPDLIILDYMWKEDDGGWSFLQMLRMSPQTATIPIVLCTAAVEEVAVLGTHLHDLGVEVVLKPFHIEQLLTVIATLLDAASNPARTSAEPPPA